jgi:hypothetical protein
MVSGVGDKRMFQHCINRAAFIDRLVVSVWTERKPVLGQLLEAKSIGILSGKSRYARSLSGKTPLTGNPIEILYGKVSRFPRVPPYQVVMQSEEVPWTGAQVNETMRLLFPAATRIQPVLAELTFDFKKRASVLYLYRHMIHGARRVEELSDIAGNTTVYIGSPKSPWEIRIYDKAKAKGVVRLELILRRNLLFGYGIRQPDTVVTLRSMKLKSMFSLRRFARARLAAATNGWRDVVRRDIVGEWEEYGGTAQLLCRMLRGRGDESRLFPQSGLQRTVEKMQRNLIW